MRRTHRACETQQQQTVPAWRTVASMISSRSILIARACWARTSLRPGVAEPRAAVYSPRATVYSPRAAVYSPPVGVFNNAIHSGLKASSFLSIKDKDATRDSFPMYLPSHPCSKRSTLLRAWPSALLPTIIILSLHEC